MPTANDVVATKPETPHAHGTTLMAVPQVPPPPIIGGAPVARKKPPLPSVGLVKLRYIVAALERTSAAAVRLDAEAPLNPREVTTLLLPASSVSVPIVSCGVDELVLIPSV